MADRYPTWDVGPTAWALANWSEFDDNAKDQDQPTSGDDAYFTDNSGDLTLDENEEAGTLEMFGFANTLALDDYSLIVGDYVNLAGTITTFGTTTIGVGGGLLLWSGVTIASGITIAMNATSGSIDIYQEDSTTWGGLLYIAPFGGTATFALSNPFACDILAMNAGTFDTANYDLTLSDEINGTGGAIAFGSSPVVVTNTIFLDNITAIINGGSLTATNLDIGSAGSLTASGNFATNASVLVDGGALDLGSSRWTQTNGDTFTHTSGTVTCTTDYSGTIDAAGNTISGITATNWINVINGVDGGGNTKLNFIISAGPPVGTMAMMGIGR